MFLMPLFRPVSHAARHVAGQLSTGSRPPLVWHRRIVTIHDAKARFVKVGHSGVLECKEVSVSRAGEDESSVLIDRDVGLAMKAALMRHIGNSIIDDPEAIPLKFYHNSLHFAHELLPYPRLILGTGFAGPWPNDISAATLWLWAPVACEITLDDTAEHQFALASRESHRQLRGVIDELKHR